MSSGVDHHAYLVVMAGGSGTRFWPKSSSKKPKQFLSFAPGEPSLLEQTLDRFQGWIPASERNRLIVTTESLAGLCKEVSSGVRVLAEPQGRNTAPCVYWAAQEIASIDPEGVMLVMPSDHRIARVDRFVEVMKSAVDWARRSGDLVTLGVTPSRPETGYGYLKTGVSPDRSILGLSKVDEFVEKPNLTRAEEFLKAGNYLWNGGMFIWRARSILDAFDQYMPEMSKVWAECSGDFKKAYPRLTATSIDYGVMEKAQNVVSFELDCGWDDLGSWTSVADFDPNSAQILAVDSSDCVVDVPTKVVALLGVKDLIVVDAGGVLMVASKSRAQDVKLLVERAKKVRPDLV